jgi:hypothetical protein
VVCGGKSEHALLTASSSFVAALLNDFDLVLRVGVRLAWVAGGSVSFVSGSLTTSMALRGLHGRGLDER